MEKSDSVTAGMIESGMGVMSDCTTTEQLKAFVGVTGRIGFNTVMGVAVGGVEFFEEHALNKRAEKRNKNVKRIFFMAD